MKTKYKESHTFPSGITVEYESDPVSEYMCERDALDTDVELIKFRERWRYLCPEIADDNVTLSITIFKELLRSNVAQEKYVEKAKNGNQKAKIYVNVIMPYTLLRIMVTARKYNVPVGTVVIQMFNAGVFTEYVDGTWHMRRW